MIGFFEKLLPQRAKPPAKKQPLIEPGEQIPLGLMKHRPEHYMESPSSLRITLPEAVVGALMERLTEKLQQVGGNFVELGGASVGRFGSGGWDVEGLVWDENSTSSWGSITFSTRFFRRVRDALTQGQELLGTWHLHPPGYGTAYSSVDYRKLFSDRVSLDADNITKFSPGVHLIFDLEHWKHPSAYTFHLPVDFEAEPCEPLQGLEEAHGILNDSGDDPLDSGIHYLIEDKNAGCSLHRFGSLYDIGLDRVAARGVLLKGLPDYSVSPDLWHLYFENFHRKTNHESFRVVSSDDGGSVKAWQVTRKTSGPTPDLLYRSVPVIWSAYHDQDAKCSGLNITVGILGADPNIIRGVSIDLPSPDAIMADLVRACAHKLQTAASDLMPISYLRPHVNEAAIPAHWRDGQEILLPDDEPVGGLLERLADPEMPDVPAFYLKRRSDDPQAAFQARATRLRLAGYQPDELQKKSVLVGGMGILGCDIASALATAGVGQLHLLDSGTVDWVNLHRQGLYTARHVFEPKAMAAAEALSQHECTTCRAQALEVPGLMMKGERLTNADWEAFSRDWQTLLNVVQDADLVFGVFDRLSTRYALQAACRLLQKPYVVAAVAAGGGEAIMYHPTEPGCYGCGVDDIPFLQDAGQCTVSTIELSRIVASLATGLAHGELNPGHQPRWREKIRITRSFQTDSRSYGASPGCGLCGEIRTGKSGAEDLARHLFEMFADREPVRS